jgi:hypothetical protein
MLSSTDISLIPDTYEATINEYGFFCDEIPCYDVLSKGIKCRCDSKNTIFKIASKLKIHFNSVKHREWLNNLNKNRNNIIVDNIKNSELIINQRLIIANLEKEIIKKDVIIQFLTSELKKNPSSSREINAIDEDLIHF